YQDEELVEFVVSGLKEYGRSKRSVFIKFDPALLLKQYPINQSKQEQSEKISSLKAIDNLKRVGCHWSGLTVRMADSIQPRYQANVYIQQNQQAIFPKHTKRLMKDAENRGVITYRGTLADIPDFAKVVSLTEKRKGVSLRNQNYFQKLMEIYGNNAYLHLAKVNLSKKLAEYRKNLEQVEESLSETVEHQKKRRTRLQQQKQSLEKYIKEFESFVQEYPDELIIAGILSISFGDTMEMLYAGMNEEFKKF
ncbi:peptidoglycan bridge formation glycyltransferase FemA/FemB family protein, partial [Streptococcus oralis]|uniref:peptidoglycan bridge formation glycyltransferase FemA/FemB family protein n=1 Tax=Streptococcus oralis TaxID=1303 RepID=UPI000B13FEA9